MNDPIGVTRRETLFHLFFQHVPRGAAWAPACEWGHATSPDLVHWNEEPVALSPAPDEVGAWSGCVVPDGSGRLLYTSVREGALELGRVREALRADDAWRVWRPGSVVVEPPSTVDLVSFRDPSVFPDGDGWSMVVGARLRGGTAAALRFTSSDLETWSYAGPLAERHTGDRDPVWTGTMWECPHLIRTPEGDVLVVSVCSEDGLHDVAAAVGTYDGNRFVAHSWRRLTSGAPYAATPVVDQAGRPALLTWLRDVADTEAGWSGALSLPLQLEVLDGEPRLSIHPTVDDLRQPEGGGPLDLVWRPTGHARLDVAGAVLETDDRTLRISAGTRTATLPFDTEIRAVVDGPVLEVVSDGVFAALPLPASSDVEPRASTGVLHRWTLR